MKIPRFIRDNIVLKITSLNAVVITVRLVISGFTQWLLSTTFGETGIARIGQVRNIMGMLTSISSLGIFNGIVKYVAEHKSNNTSRNNTGHRIGDDDPAHHRQTRPAKVISRFEQ